ncbi:Sds3-like protein [Lipomyces japonicus]|uniref:Sds3-like protein n=1 Tax=Lipomyces japonicus TaxID=56871 RepID=UPI0034CEAEF1
MDPPSPTSTPSPTLGPSLGTTSLGVVATKRDRRRLNLSDRYAQLTNTFTTQKEIIYKDSLEALEVKMRNLHSASDLEYLERVTDLEEIRDIQLTSLYLYEQYLFERAEHDYERDVQAAEEEYTAMATNLRERLLSRLESQKRKLREDKELLDIANDHSLLLSVAGYQTPGSPGGSGGMMGSVGERRKNLRRRGDMAVASAIMEGAGKKRKRGKGGDKEELAAFWSDREALPFGYHRDLAEKAASSTTSGTGRHREKPFGGLQGLKADEANEDLAVMRKKRKPRK